MTELRPVVLFDTDCTVVAADCKTLRPGIREWMDALRLLGYDIHMWSAAGAEHAGEMAHRFDLPIARVHDKQKYVSGGPQKRPEALLPRKVALVVDDDETEFLPEVPFLHVEHYLGLAVQAATDRLTAASSHYEGGRKMAVELRKDPDPNATEPTGMCGSPTKCKDCPSDFLCVMKAQGEMELIEARNRNRCDET